MMGRGEASGEKRVLIAAETAISNPLIEDPSIKRASGLLISITGLINLDFADVRAVPAPPSDDSLEGIVRVSVVATGIDNTSVMRQPQAGEGALTNLAEKLRHGSRHIADRSQQDSSFRPMPITPSLLALPQAGPLMASAASNTPAPERMSRAPRMPRIDELPLPAQSEICAAQQKEGKDGHPDKRRTSLMQRLASVGLSRKAEKGGPVRANAASRTFDPRNSSVHPAADSRSVSHNSIDEDVLDSPAWPPSELSPASSPVR